MANIVAIRFDGTFPELQNPTPEARVLAYGPNSAKNGYIKVDTLRNLIYSRQYFGTTFKLGGVGEYAPIWRAQLTVNQSYMFQIWYLGFTSDYFDENGQRPLIGRLDVAFAAKPDAAELDPDRITITHTDAHGQDGDFVIQDNGSGLVTIYVKKTAWNQSTQFGYIGAFSTTGTANLVNQGVYGALPASAGSTIESTASSGEGTIINNLESTRADVSLSANQGRVLKELIEDSSTELAPRDFYKADGINYRKGPKDIIIEDTGDIIITPPFMGNLVITKFPVNIRGVVSAAGGNKEFTIDNTSGGSITVENGFVGAPANSSFNIGSTLTIPNGGKAAFKSEDDAWVLGVVNELAFSDHLDSVNAQISVGSDGLEVITGVFDRYIGENISFKEYDSIPELVDGIVFVQILGKYWKRTGIYNAEMFGAIANEEVDNTVALQMYIDTCVRANQYNIEISKDYYIQQININSFHSGINIYGKGTLLMLDGPIRRRAIYIWDESNDIENITIDIKVKGFSRYTLDADSDSIYNKSIGQDHNGVVAVAHTASRIRNIRVICRAESLEGTAVQFSGVENGYADVTGKFIGTHCFGAEVLNFGANATWPEDFNPNVKFRVDGVNCNTAFDLSTTGSSKSDMGKNIPVAEILGVTLRNQRSNTKVHGFWGVTQTGTIDLKNDERVQGLLELPAFRIYNLQIAYYKGSTIRINGFWRAFEGYSTTGVVSIQNLIIENCMDSMLCTGRTEINNIELNDVYVVSEIALNSTLVVDNFTVKKVRRQKWVNELTAIQSQGYWADLTIPDVPMKFVADGGKFIVNNQFTISDVGEDSLGDPEIDDFFRITRNNTEVYLQNIFTSVAATQKVNNLIRIHLDGAPWVTKVNIGGYTALDDITDTSILNRTRGILVCELRDVIPSAKLQGDVFNFSLSRQKNRYEWIDNQGNIKWSETLPATITGGNFLKATTNQVWEGSDDVLFLTSKGLNDRIVRQNKIVDTVHYNFSSVDDRLYVIFDYVNPGNAFILTGRFQAFDELIGENQGAPKTVIPDTGITVRAVNNSLVIPTNSRYHIRFNTATEAILTVTPDVTTLVPNASTAQRGIIEQATDAEVQAGEDTERAVSPKQLKENYTSLAERTNNSSGTVALTPLSYNVKEERITFSGTGTVTLNGFTAALSDRALILINSTPNDLNVAAGAAVAVPFSTALVIPANQSARFQVNNNLILKEI